MGNWVRRIIVGGAAACLLSFGALLVLEESGLLVRLVRQRLVRELGPVGQRVTIEHAELVWFEPGIELFGVALTPPGEAGLDALELEYLHLTLSPRLDELRAVRIRGGRVLLGPRLFDDWNRIAAAHTEHAGPEQGASLPHGSATGIAVALELLDGARFELGTLDLCARPGRSGGVELAGRMAPSLGGVLQSVDPIRINGALSPQAASLWASARDLALESRALPAGALARPLPLAEGSARLTLDAAFELLFAEAARPRGRVRASLAQGRVRLKEDEPPIEDLAFEIEAELTPPPGSDPWRRESWDGCAALHARTGSMPLWAWAEFGRDVPEEGWMRAWGRARSVPLDPETLSTLGLEPHFAFAREMLAPSGRVDLAGALLLGSQGAKWTRDIALHARSKGEVGLTFLGLPGDPASGLLLPLSNVSGQLVLGERSAGERPWTLTALDLSADHGSGQANGWMQLTAPRRAPVAFAQPELDLVLSTPSLNVDAALTRVLAENHYLKWIGPAFSPENGTLAVDWRLRTGAELGGTCAAGTVQIKGVSLRWEDVPVQMDGVDGELALLWGRALSVARDQPLLTHRTLGVEYRLDNRGSPRKGAQAGVQGWMREEALPPVFDPAAVPVDWPQEIRIEIDELGLRGRDFDVLAGSFPDLEREVSEYGAVGRMHVRFRGAQPALTLPFRSEIEATPLDVRVRPQFFQRQTKDVRGRVLIQTEEVGDAEPVNAAQLLLAGSWPGGVELFANGTIPATGDARVHIAGAGIDPTNTSFKGALITTLAADPGASGGIDLSSWTLAGPVDLELETTFDPASPEPARNRYRIQLRDNDFTADELVLRDLHGTLEQDDEILVSPRVEATLGGHALELHNLVSFPLAFLARVKQADPWLAREGFWKDPTGRALQCDLHTRDLPLDADHLVGVLDADALASLRENPSWRGLIDILGARVVVTSELDDQGKTAMRGVMRLHDLELELGLPIQIDTARVTLEEMVQESERVRGWARIDGLEAHIAERELSAASMIAGYVNGRLTIDNLSGGFEGGRLESLGGALGGTSKALGIDFSEPHRFDVAIALEDVNISGLMRGVFQSSIADEGVLDASVQLSGIPGEILGLSGRGSLSLDEGALWSVPVVRALFGQLGFEKGGLFDRLRARYELRDGRVQVSHLEIQSSLLDLVGEGWQDLDGRLAYDMEVRYDLLDKLGPFGRVLYWLNNNLVRVAVRGDFDRPEIKIRNSILEWITGFDDAPPRRLPLPRFSPLGPRF